MFSKLSSLLLLLLILVQSSLSLDIECSYEKEDWGSIKIIYECEVKSSLFVTARGTYIYNVTGNHIRGLGYSDVQGIHILSKVTHYLPKGIAIFFENLIGLSVERSELKKITQSDLKVFPKLKHLWLLKNNIEVLEENLFKFNPNLIYININDNKIKKVHPSTFGGLNILEILLLSNNECINEYADDSYGVVRMIVRMKIICKAPETTTIPEATTTTETVRITEKIPVEESMGIGAKFGIVFGIFGVILIAAVGGLLYARRY